MYIGRFVILGRTAAGAWYLGYRVSSRSFPNRTIRFAGDRAMVLPTADATQSDNPYITYNCLRWHGDTAVVGNGSQVDPIIDKIKLGYPLRDALALSLLALDYEHDAYNTPRVVAAVDGAGDDHG
jgi:IMP cyclohydrolase